MRTGQTETPGLTRQLAERAQAIRYESLPDDVRTIARHSILDFLGLATVGSREPLIRMFVEEAADLEARPEASAVASAMCLPAFWAATINSAAGHALAYDDVNMTIPGHGTAVALPSAFAIAEKLGASGRALLEAFVAGFETVCHVGAMVEPSHYDRGFHASATIGTFGAAVAAGRLMSLDTDTLTHALSLSTSMAAGLKGSFGTMLKPFQVGRAAGSGVLAASLARRGLIGRGDMLEAAQGFLSTHSAELKRSSLPSVPRSFYLRSTLYKYHAACYLAHAPIESAVALRDRGGWRPDDVAEVIARVNPMCGKVCNIQEPRTAPEIGYSIRMLTAMALLGITVTRPEDLNPNLLAEASVNSLRTKVRVEFHADLAETAARIELVTANGERHHASNDVGQPAADLNAQGRKIRRKFLSLVAPIMGESDSEKLMTLIDGLEELPSVEPIAELMRASASRVQIAR